MVLASKSPRRRQLMALVTPDFVVDDAAVDETTAGSCEPAVLAASLAQLKARAMLSHRPDDIIIGCDTVVELDGKPIGKPDGPTQATQMLQAMSGRRHLVHTGVCILVPGMAQPEGFTETTAVYFAQLPGPAIESYVATPEPYDKAGGYGIQGWAARYVTRIEGCYYNVMGLPVAHLFHRLAALGVLPGGPS